MIRSDGDGIPYLEDLNGDGYMKILATGVKKEPMIPMYDGILTFGCQMMMQMVTAQE
jgi:hypothetical protein